MNMKHEMESADVIIKVKLMVGLFVVWVVGALGLAWANGYTPVDSGIEFVLGFFTFVWVITFGVLTFGAAALVAQHDDEK